MFRIKGLGFRVKGLGCSEKVPQQDLHGDKTMQGSDAPALMPKSSH